MKFYIFCKENDIKTYYTNEPYNDIGENKFGLMASASTATQSQSEKNRISKRIKAGLDNAKANGKTLGRPKGAIVKLKLEDKKDEVLNDIANGLTKTFISKKYKVSRSTLDRFLERVNDECNKM